MAYLRLAAVIALCLMMATRACAQNIPSELYGKTAGSALYAAVATTTPLSSPCCRAAYVVTMSNALLGAPVELIAWHDTGSALVQIATANWNPGAGNTYGYASTTLDANRVVAAYVDEKSTLYVGVWMVGAAKPSALYLQGFGSVAASGTSVQAGISGISITALSSTEVVTAAKDPNGDLRVQTWGIGANGSVTPQGTAIGGTIQNPYIVAINTTQVVTAVDTQSNERKLVAWEIGSGGTITRQGSLAVNEGAGNITTGIALAPLGGILGTYEVMTSNEEYTNDNGCGGSGYAVQITSWTISSAGAVTLGKSQTGGWGCNNYASATAWTPSLVPFTVELDFLAPDYTIVAETWLYTGTGWIENGIAGDNTLTDPFGNVAIAAEGTDASGRGYFVTAFPGTGGVLQVQVWSYYP
jgi:hypothetical protein